jgi:hypothetical protein
MLAGVSDPGGMNQLDNETNMTIPTDLAIMERRNNSTKDYNIVLMTRRIANIVADVQQEKDRHYSWVGSITFTTPALFIFAGILGAFSKVMISKKEKRTQGRPRRFFSNTGLKHF